MHQRLNTTTKKKGYELFLVFSWSFVTSFGYFLKSYLKSYFLKPKLKVGNKKNVNSEPCDTLHSDTPDTYTPFSDTN